MKKIIVFRNVALVTKSSWAIKDFFSQSGFFFCPTLSECNLKNRIIRINKIKIKV